MKKTIQSFLDSGKIAIAGASPNKDNFGRMLMTELEKLGKEVFIVNPKYDQIEGKPTLPSVAQLPVDVESLILAVPPELTEEIVDQCIGSGIKRVWMVRGMGKGAYSEKAYSTCSENKIEVVHGFCPMMFYGGGGHKFHLWLRKTFGIVPGEYQLSAN
jgi:predicted CoA-binding protein